MFIVGGRNVDAIHVMRFAQRRPSLGARPCREVALEISILHLLSKSFYTFPSCTHECQYRCEYVAHRLPRPNNIKWLSGPSNKPFRYSYLLPTKCIRCLFIHRETMQHHYGRYNKWDIKTKRYINKKVGQLAAKTQKAEARKRYWRRHSFQSPINRSG